MMKQIMVLGTTLAFVLCACDNNPVALEKSESFRITNIYGVDAQSAIVEYEATAHASMPDISVIVYAGAEMFEYPGSTVQLKGGRVAGSASYDRAPDHMHDSVYIVSNWKTTRIKLRIQ